MNLKNLLKIDRLIIFLIFLSALIIWPALLPGYFSHHDDLQVMRVFEMRKCIEDLQIPCRWVPDMGYGNGFPLYNYYSAFPYYLGALLSYFFGFVGAAKLLFIFPLIGGGITMYLLAKELFGRWPGLVVAVLYMFAPYRSLDTYVRGAVAESFALAIVPLLFYFGFRITQKASLQNLVGMSLSLAVLLTTHNIMSMFFFPMFILWVGWFLKVNGFKSVKPVFLSLLIGIGLAAFFVFPAFFEKSLVQTDNLTKLDLDFRAHFVTVEQLFLNRSWGYGASVPGSGDTISFQIGWPLWWIVVLSVFTFVASLFKRKITNNKKLTLLLLAIFALGVFMTHNKSAFIWEKIGILRYTQFPWRFLSVVIFSASLLAGTFLKTFSRKLQIIVGVLIITLAVALNWQYFKPEHFDDSITDQNKLSGIQWEVQQKAAILDYLPVGATEPREPGVAPIIKEGQAEVSSFKNFTNHWQMDIQVEKAVKVEMPIFDFPNWQINADGQMISHVKDSYTGRVVFDLKPGSYRIVGRLSETPIRVASNVISLLVGILLISIVANGKIRKIFI